MKVFNPCTKKNIIVLYKYTWMYNKNEKVAWKQVNRALYITQSCFKACFLMCIKCSVLKDNYIFLGTNSICWNHMVLLQSISHHKGHWEGNQYSSWWTAVTGNIYDSFKLINISLPKLDYCWCVGGQEGKSVGCFLVWCLSNASLEQD